MLTALLTLARPGIATAVITLVVLLLATWLVATAVTMPLVAVLCGAPAGNLAAKLIIVAIDYGWSK